MILRLEGLAVGQVALAATAMEGNPVGCLRGLFLVSDIAMLGYLVNPSDLVGAYRI